VFSPSFPPAICTTISVRLVASWEKLAPSCASVMAEATPRLKMAGITIPAETTSIPSFIIALRDNFIRIPLVQLILRRGHHQVKRPAHAIEWIRLATAQRDLLPAGIARRGKVAQHLAAAVVRQGTVEQEGGEVINELLRRAQLICVRHTL